MIAWFSTVHQALYWPIFESAVRDLFETYSVRFEATAGRHSRRAFSGVGGCRVPTSAIHALRLQPFTGVSICWSTSLLSLANWAPGSVRRPSQHNQVSA